MADAWVNIRPIRAHLQRRGDAADDGWGGTVPGSGEFATQATVWVWMKPLRGTETVMAARLSGNQPYVCRVRKTAQTEGITVSWQLVDTSDANRVFAVKAPPADPTGKNAWIEFIVSTGSPS